MSYDTWKLATPPEYEWGPDECEDCRKSGIIEHWCKRCGQHGEHVRNGECRCDDGPEHPDCEMCDGTGDPRNRRFTYPGMREALIEDGEKLRQLTGEDHGPYFGDDDEVPF